MTTLPPNDEQSPVYAKIIDLPYEILLRILEDVDERTLYNHITLCRSLHECALHILFQRHVPDMAKTGRLWLNSHPRYLLPALHGALSLPDIPNVFVWFDQDPNRLVPEIRILTDLISRSPANQALHLNLNRIRENARSNFGVLDPKRVTKALQDLLDVALEKGCRTINVDAANEFKNMYIRPGPPHSVIVMKPQLQKHTFATAHPVASVWSASDPERTVKKRRRTISQIISSLFKPDKLPPPTETVSAIVPPKATEENQPEPLLEEPKEPPPPPLPVKRRWQNKALIGGTLFLSTDFMFEPMWMDWTLCLLNQTNLSTFQLNTNNFSLNTLRDVFPSINIPHLTNFEIYGDKVLHYDLVLFLHRHSYRLKGLKLDIKEGSVRPTVLSDSDLQGTPGFNLPKLEKLEISPHSVQWLLETISTSRTDSLQRSLANISRLDLISSSVSIIDHFFKVDEALRAIATFTTAEWPKIDIDSGGNDYAWFSMLVIDTSSMFSASYVEWLKKHAEYPRQSALASITTLRQFHIYNSSWKGSFGDEELDLLPSFLALFKKLNQFGMASASTDQLRKKKPEFWKRVWRACPTLRILMFNWSTYRIGDLVNGHFIST